MDSRVQIFPQDITVVLFPATGKRILMHQQDLVSFMPSLELDNHTLSEEPYASMLWFLSAEGFILMKGVP